MSVVAGWIKRPLGAEVGLSPGNIVLDGDPTLPKGGTEPSHFSAHVLWPNSWMEFVGICGFEMMNGHGGKLYTKTSCVRVSGTHG